MPSSPTAFEFGSSPFGDNNFNACVSMAQAASQAQNVPDLSAITPDNAGAMAVTSVGGMLGGAMGSAATGGAAGMGAINGLTGNFCTGPFTPPTIEAGSCDQYMVNDTFNSALLDKTIATANAAAQTAGCKAASAVAAGKILGCYQNNFQSIKDNMQLVKRDFDANMQGMNNYITQVQAAVQNQTTIQTALGGADGKGGKIGSLNDSIGKITQLLANVSGAGGSSAGPGGNTLSSLQTQINQQNDDITSFTKSQVTAHASGVEGCISGTGAASSGIHTCPSSTGDLLSPRDCVLSVYRDSTAERLAGNTTKVGQIDQTKANFAKSVLSHRLDEMLASLDGPNPIVQNAQQFKAQYGAELAKYGPAGQQLLTEVNNCDAQVTSQVAQQLADPSQALGKKAASLRDGATTLTSEIGGMVNQMDTAARDAVREFTGQEPNGNINGFGCVTVSVPNNQGDLNSQQTALNQQLKCAQQLNTSLNSLLNGTPAPGSAAPASQPLNIPGLTQSPALCAQVQGNCRCAGLRDCLNQANQLQAASVSQVAALKGNGTFNDPACPNSGGCPGLTKFNHDATLSIQAAAQQAADMFSARVASAKAQFAQIKGMLGGLNIPFPSTGTSGASVQDICPPPPDPVNGPICGGPMTGDFGQKLAGLAGLPNIDPKQFDDAIASSNSDQTQFSQNQTDLRAKVQQLLALENQCKKVAADKKISKVAANDRSSLNKIMANCGTGGSSGPSLGLSDISSPVATLQSDLQSACRNDPANGDCQSLGTDLTMAQSNCNKMSNEAFKANQAQANACSAQQAAAGASGSIDCTAFGGKAAGVH